MVSGRNQRLLLVHLVDVDEGRGVREHNLFLDFVDFASSQETTRWH